MDREIKPYKLWLHIALIVFILVNIGVAVAVAAGKGFSWKFPGFPGFKSDSNQPVDVPKVDYSLTAIIDSSCTQCSGVDEITKFVTDSPGVNLVTNDTVDYATSKDKAQALIDKYKITKLPSVIITGPTPDAASDFGKFWTGLGTDVGGDFVLNKVQPPYRDLASGEVKGVFQVTYLSDKTCTQCYDVTLHRNAFQNLSMVVANEKTLDVSDADGKALIKKYKIKLVPTIVVTGDLSEYDAFQAVWPKVGTKEADGAYVFRDGVSLMGTYKDLSTGKVIIPPPPPTDPSAAPTAGTTDPSAPPAAGSTGN